MPLTNTQHWSEIEDLPANWELSLDDKPTLTMVQVWHDQAAALREKDLFKKFLSELQRQWAIETGVIEGIYSISEGATLVLIEKGLDASLLSHEETSDDPELVIAKIQDQHQAIQGLYQFVSGARQLGTSYIKELHSVLTAHQDTYVARDTLGNIVTRDLPRGTYKRLPNNVEHPDGGGFEYCPPEHVDAEMERLVSMHLRHEQLQVPAHVSAAWLHHRFTLIHPFTDGNGRVARCLATLVLLKHQWLPLVVTRKSRDSYIRSLRQADAGDLRPLVEFFGELQKKAIREAFALTSEVIDKSTAVDSILDEVKAKLHARKLADMDERKRAVTTADSLHTLADARLREIAPSINETIQESPGSRSYVTSATRNDDRANYNYQQIISGAKQLGYFANLAHYQAWTALVIQTLERAELLFSFHGVGHEAAGVLGCSAMFYSKELAETGNSVVREVIPLSDAPFEFNYLEDPADVQRRFRIWLEDRIVTGLEKWKQVI